MQTKAAALETPSKKFETNHPIRSNSGQIRCLIAPPSLSLRLIPQSRRSFRRSSVCLQWDQIVIRIWKPSRERSVGYCVICRETKAKTLLQSSHSGLKRFSVSANGSKANRAKGQHFRGTYFSMGPHFSSDHSECFVFPK